MKGSLTVEAAYIVPFSLLVILIVCGFLVFEYNRSVLKITGYECILRTMEEREADEKIWKENLLRRAQRLAEERTLGVGEVNTTMKVTASKVSVTYSCDQKLIFEAPLNITVIYERTYPELTLRTAGRIGEMYAGNIKERSE